MKARTLEDLDSAPRPSRSELATVGNVMRTVAPRILSDRSQRLARDENRVVPLVALIVVFGQVLPLRLRGEDFEPGITRERA